MDSDITFLASLDDEWKELVVMNIRVQENLQRLPQFSFWNGVNENYRQLNISENDKGADELSRLPAKIDIFSSQVTSLEPLAGTKNLKEFYMGETNIVDITPICNNDQMTNLCCYNTPIKQIGPLVHLKNLKRLCLSRTRITDLTPLGSLMSLEKLSVYKTEIQNLAPLSKLTKLKKLNINFTKVKDISPLFGLHNLEELHCYGTEIDEEQIVFFMINCPNCMVVTDYEQPESEYDDFR